MITARLSAAAALFSAVPLVACGGSDEGPPTPRRVNVVRAVATFEF